MKIITITYQKVKIQLSFQELTVFGNILDEVYNALHELEFETRVGVTFRQARSFLSSFTQESEQASEQLIAVSLSLSEISLLNNLLNEVCYGIKLQSFETKVGMTEEDVKQFLNLVNQAMKEMDSIREERQKSRMPPPSNFREIDNICSLEAEGYKVTFYCKKIAGNFNNIGLFIVLKFTSFNSVELMISSLPKSISMEKLEEFINNLEKYIEFSQEATSDFGIPFQIFQSNIFQVQALERGITSDNEEYINLNFMISLAQARGNIIKPSIGVQAAVLFKNIRSFISSMQKVMIDIKN